MSMKWFYRCPTCGATYDIIIDAFRIDSLKPEQLGVGSGMSQYGWRLGSAGAGALALVVAERAGWSAAYAAAALFALPHAPCPGP